MLLRQLIFWKIYLKKILPGIEQDYKSLTTKKEQRDSFRAQLVATVDTGLETASVNSAGADAEAAEAEGFIEIEEARRRYSRSMLLMMKNLLILSQKKR